MQKQYSRLDVMDLKVQIVKKIGKEKSKLYFHYLTRFLSNKLPKVKFNRFCLHILGKENRFLHNQFIHSILKNSCCSTKPPPIRKNDMMIFVPNHSTCTSILSSKAAFHKRVKTVGSFVEIGHLLDTETLRRRMTHMASSLGLSGGVSAESANLLNNMLDVHLKKLIGSCMDLVGKWDYRKNDFRQRHNNNSVSMLDLKIAMELNMQRFGRNGPLLMEKIVLSLF